MVSSQAKTVTDYLNSLQEDRREIISELRQLILDNLPQGYEETMNWGMISYEVPLNRYPETYNKQPLNYIALASQKNYCSLYLMCVYQEAGKMGRLVKAFKAANKKLNMGKSCIRFKSLDDLPLETIAEIIASTSVSDFIAEYEQAREQRGTC
ncbi:DUF1801 domain-containing protein [Rubinisphaera italica]|uniref:YdhG-like domain-containing protein n=1 Tax=Rubinisphaera italica TaxID=2527969 RepID=A0A5C5XG83_9PLAN|nr:DUF1801 domain-containing protein [Rubinisphaera italica]TWT62020.1 hypothetical protein Pan54_27590 [Rubinisphaera italica]